MQTATERRYIEIYAEIIRSGQSAEQTAARLGIAAITAHRAVRWARDRGLHLVDTKDKLRAHLHELGALLHSHERAYSDARRRYRRAMRLGPKNGAAARGWIRVMDRVGNSVLAFRTRIMELEGIYKHVLNIQHGGAIAVRAEPDLGRLGDDELNQLEQLTRRTIASNN